MGVNFTNKSLYWCYSTRYRVYDRLGEAAVRLPSLEYGDPIKHFIDADACGDSMRWQACLATAYRMRDLVDTFEPMENFAKLDACCKAHWR